MGFIDDTDKQRRHERRTWADTFISLQPNQPVVIQMLEENVSPSSHSIWKHWIKQAKYSPNNPKRGVAIPCPGYDVCPICLRNRELPDRDHPDYIAASRRIVVNVIDWTPVKVCPLCQTSNSGEAARSKDYKCSYCDTPLADVELAQPKVKLLERGQPLFEDMSKRADKVKNTDGSGISWTQIPFELEPTADKRNVIVTALSVNPINVAEFEDMFVSREDVYIWLNPAEIMELVEGGSVSEVLKARHGGDADNAYGDDESSI